MCLMTGCKEKTLDTCRKLLYDITGDDMEKIARQGLLYDFYGALLTEHQRHIYEDVVFYDLSLSEIAEEQGISRQGVHDLIKRCNKILEGYEEKLHLVDKFERTKKLAREIQSLTKEFSEKRDMELIHRIKEISGEIIELEAH
ncbi:hypothetical protein LXJ15735_21430 [Lacrimispora xylanolytica]